MSGACGTRTSLSPEAPSAKSPAQFSAGASLPFLVISLPEHIGSPGRWEAAERRREPAERMPTQEKGAGGTHALISCLETWTSREPVTDYGACWPFTPSSVSDQDIQCKPGPHPAGPGHLLLWDWNWEGEAEGRAEFPHP